jgi:hypothetical protein
MTTEIETLENAQFELDSMGYPWLSVEVNGRSCRVMRDKALRMDGSIASLASFGGFDDFFIIIQPSEEHGIHKHTKLKGYTNDRRYVALVWQFVEAVDNGRFQPGPVEIPA